MLQKTKFTIRKNVLTQCSQINSEQRRKAATSAANLLLESNLFQSSQRIACYLSLTNEFDTDPIIQAIWQEGKNCYLPVLEPEKKLLFAPYHPNDALTKNKYQIPEPSNKNFISAENLDLVIVPLVGFNLQGKRLGKGGGYYDRTFSFRSNTAHHKPFLLGLGYGLQQIDDLPSEPWDVRLDGVLTEHTLVIF